MEIIWFDNFKKTDKGWSTNSPFMIVDRGFHYLLDRTDSPALFDYWIIRTIIDKRGKEIPIIGIKPHEHTLTETYRKEHKLCWEIFYECECGYKTSKVILKNIELKTLDDVNALGSMYLLDQTILKKQYPELYAKKQALNIVNRAIEKLQDDIKSMELSIIYWSDSYKDTLRALYKRARKIVVPSGETYELPERDVYIPELEKKGIRYERFYVTRGAGSDVGFKDWGEIFDPAHGYSEEIPYIRVYGPAMFVAHDHEAIRKLRRKMKSNVDDIVQIKDHARRALTIKKQKPHEKLRFLEAHKDELIDAIAALSEDEINALLKEYGVDMLADVLKADPYRFLSK